MLPDEARIAEFLAQAPGGKARAELEGKTKECTTERETANDELSR